MHLLLLLGWKTYATGRPERPSGQACIWATGRFVPARGASTASRGLKQERCGFRNRSVAQRVSAMLLCSQCSCSAGQSVSCGKLNARRAKVGCQPEGKASLTIEWSWRIERIRSILGRLWSSEPRGSGMCGVSSALPAKAPGCSGRG